MLISSNSLWLAQTNTYVVAREPGDLAIVVDAPPDPAAIAELTRRHNLTPTALLLTHGHVDHMGGAGAAALGLFAAGAGDEDAAHSFGRGPEEVCAVLPGLSGRVHQFEPRFVDERGGLQRVARAFTGHLMRGQAA